MIAPTALVQARLNLHWALQIPAAVANTLVRPTVDFSHTTFSWDESIKALVTDMVKRPMMLCAGLRPAEFSLILLDGIGAVLVEKSLAGQTLTWGLAWIEETVRQLPTQPFERLAELEHELPEHPAGAGAPFEIGERETLEELGRWFGNAAALLHLVRREVDSASPVRCWPHHFDIDIVIPIEPAADSEQKLSVGVGMSPGDGSYAEPYFYVTPNPHPDRSRLAYLPHGHWHTEGWTGAVLTGTELLRTPNQAEVAEAFVRHAVRVCYALFG